jgi:hypothetical protein
MRAHGRERRMGRRFALVIGVVALGVMALGAQAGAGVVKHDAAEAKRVHRVTVNLTIFHESNLLFYGEVRRGQLSSEVRRCQGGRQVTVFKQRPGADRKLGTNRSHGKPPVRGGIRSPFSGFWWGRFRIHLGDRLYATVRRERHRLFVCAADRSRTIRVTFI